MLIIFVSFSFLLLNSGKCINARLLIISILIKKYGLKDAKILKFIFNLQFFPLQSVNCKMPLTLIQVVVLLMEIILYSFHLSMLILMIAKRKTVFTGPFFDIFRIILSADLIAFIIVGFVTVDFWNLLIKVFRRW